MGLEPGLKWQIVRVQATSECVDSGVVNPRQARRRSVVHTLIAAVLSVPCHSFVS
jgi:hypothetical protein